MVRDDDAVDAAVERQPRVLRGQHPLHHERPRPLLAQATQVLPGGAGVREQAADQAGERHRASRRCHTGVRQVAEAERRIHRAQPARVAQHVERHAGLQPRRHHEAVADVAPAPGDDSHVDRHHQRVEAGVAHAPEEVVRDLGARPQVELEPERPRRRPRDVLDRVARHRAEREDGAGVPGRAGALDLPAAARDAGHPRRRDHHRHGDLPPEDARAQAPLAHVDELPRPEGQAVERGNVPAQRDLRPRAALDEVEGQPGEAPPRRVTDVVERRNSGHQLPTNRLDTLAP